MLGFEHLEVLEVSPCEYQSTQAHMAFEWVSSLRRSALHRTLLPNEFMTGLVTTLQETSQRCPHLQPAGIVSRQLCRYSQQLERICRYIAPGGDVMLVASMERDVTCLVEYA